MYDENLRKMVKTLDRLELENLCVKAIFHLRMVSGSRNSYSPESVQNLHDAGVGLPQRTRTVENMHRQAYEFLQKVDK